MILLCVLVFDDSSQHMSGASRWRMGYAVAFFIFFVLVWNFLVLLYKLIEYIIKCRRAKARALATTGGLAVGAMVHDHDYEATQTKYVRTGQGDYELIERNDLLVRGPRDSDQSNLKFFDSDIDRRMKTRVAPVDVIHEEIYDPVVVKEVITHTHNNKL